MRAGAVDDGWLFQGPYLGTKWLNSLLGSCDWLNFDGYLAWLFDQIMRWASRRASVCLPFVLARALSKESRNSWSTYCIAFHDNWASAVRPASCSRFSLAAVAEATDALVYLNSCLTASFDSPHSSRHCATVLHPPSSLSNAWARPFLAWDMYYTFYSGWHQSPSSSSISSTTTRSQHSGPHVLAYWLCLCN